MRTVTQASSPYTRFSIEQLRLVFSYATALNSTFTDKQLGRIASGRKHVDWVSGRTADQMLDFYEHRASALPGAPLDKACLFHLHRQFIDAPGALSAAFVKERVRAAAAAAGGANADLAAAASDAASAFAETEDAAFDSDASALLCPACAACCGKASLEAPPRSIASGRQRGSLRPFGIRPLSPLEQQAIAIVRPYAIVLKISGANAGRGEQAVLRGHIISTPQPTAPCDVVAHTTLLLPHLNVHERVSILWTGAGSDWNVRRDKGLPCGSVAVTEFELLLRIIMILHACKTPGYEAVDLVSAVDAEAYFKLNGAARAKWVATKLAPLEPARGAVSADEDIALGSLLQLQGGVSAARVRYRTRCIQPSSLKRATPLVQATDAMRTVHSTIATALAAHPPGDRVTFAAVHTALDKLLIAAEKALPGSAIAATIPALSNAKAAVTASDLDAGDALLTLLATVRSGVRRSAAFI